MLHKAEWSNVIAIRYRGQRTRWPAGLLAQAERPPRTSILSMFASTPLPYYYSLVGKKVLNLGIRGLSFFLVLLDALVYFVRELQLTVDVASIRIIWVRTDLEVLRRLPLQDPIPPGRAVAFRLDLLHHRPTCHLRQRPGPASEAPRALRCPRNDGRS